jgi:ribosomal-protein-alanine N-acetyltransferase
MEKEIRCNIRWMIKSDMREVLEIESENFEFPWTLFDYVKCLKQRNSIGMVAVYDNRVVGFVIYELHKTRIHVLNFAVANDFKRRGVGSQMIAKLLGKLSPQRRTRIVLEVRESNLPAQLFFRAMGFEAVRILRDFYCDSPEDAYQFDWRYRSGQNKKLETVRVGDCCE